MISSRRQFFLRALGAAAVVPALTQCESDELPPIIRVLSPNGGEIFTPQALETIRWKAIGLGPLRIEIASTEERNWTTIAEYVSPEPEFFEWKVPNVNSRQCRIRISDTLNPQVQDESDAPFTIQSKLELLSPNGGEIFKPYDKTTIRWRASAVGLLLIELSSTGGQFWTEVAKNVPSETGVYEWTLPVRNNTQCLVRISEMSNPTLKDESDAFFTIREIFFITLSEHPELQKVGGFKVFDNASFAGIAVLVTGVNTFKVLSLNCTHLGCPVQYQEEGYFRCPCHGSSFSKDGCLAGGPAQAPLNTYAHEFDAARGVLTVLNRFSGSAC